MRNAEIDKMIVDELLNIDWLTTTEFCKKYDWPLPVFTGDIKSSALLIMQVDAIKFHRIIEFAKSKVREV